MACTRNNDDMFPLTVDGMHRMEDDELYGGDLTGSDVVGESTHGTTTPPKLR